MKISGITLQDIKCFENFNLNLNKPETNEPLSVCALVGANGSGKSTILKSIVSTFTTLNSEYNGDKLSDSAIRLGANILCTQVNLKLTNKECERLKSANSNISINYLHMKKSLDDKVTYDYILYPDEILIIEDKKLSKSKRNEYSIFISNLVSSKQDGIIIYFDAFRYISINNPSGPNFSDFINEPKKNALTSNINLNGCISDRGFNLKQWFVNLDYSVLKNSNTKNNLIFNHLKKAFELLLHPLIFNNINDEGNIIFEDTKSKKMIEIDMLSDGFKSIFLIISEIILRLSLIEDDVEQPFYMKEAIVLIDEIDCHIHPKWQKSLMPSLRKLFPNCQFIITTHSPFILESLQQYEIIKIGDKNII